MGKLTIIDGKKTCTKCAETKETSQFDFFTDPRYKKKYIASKCKACTVKATYAWRKKNPRLTSLGRQRCNAKLKLLVISKYGKNEQPICHHCGFDNVKALCIDHVENNGKEDRAKLRDKYFAGSVFYRWLRDNNYPPGYQTLCANCNLIKEIDRRNIWK